MEILIDPRTGKRDTRFRPRIDRENEVYDFGFPYNPNDPFYNGPYNLYDGPYPGCQTFQSAARQQMSQAPPIYVVDAYGRTFYPPYRSSIRR